MKCDLDDTYHALCVVKESYSMYCRRDTVVQHGLLLLVFYSLYTKLQ